MRRERWMRSGAVTVAASGGASTAGASSTASTRCCAVVRGAVAAASDVDVLEMVCSAAALADGVSAIGALKPVSGNPRAVTTAITATARPSATIEPMRRPNPANGVRHRNRFMHASRKSAEGSQAAGAESRSCLGRKERDRRQYRRMHRTSGSAGCRSNADARLRTHPAREWERPLRADRSWMRRHGAGPTALPVARCV